MTGCNPLLRIVCMRLKGSYFSVVWVPALSSNSDMAAASVTHIWIVMGVVVWGGTFLSLQSTGF